MSAWLCFLLLDTPAAQPQSTMMRHLLFLSLLSIALPAPWALGEDVPDSTKCPVWGARDIGAWPLRANASLCFHNLTKTFSRSGAYTSVTLYQTDES